MNQSDPARLQTLAALDSRAVATRATGPCRLERRPLGKVDFPDGRVFACDPFVPLDQEPFLQTVAGGSFDVSLIVAVATEPTYLGHPTVAVVTVAAIVDLKEATPVRWRPASRGPGDGSGAYAVSGGAGCFMGAAVAARLFENNDAAGREMEQLLKTSPGGTLDVEGTGKVAFFATSGDDTVYDTWWGEDAAGHPSMLLTELEEIHHPEELAKSLDAIPRRPWWKVWG